MILIKSNPSDYYLDGSKIKYYCCQCTEISFHNLSENGIIRALKLGYSPAIQIVKTTDMWIDDYWEERDLVCHLD